MTRTTSERVSRNHLEEGVEEGRQRKETQPGQFGARLEDKEKKGCFRNQRSGHRGPLCVVLRSFDLSG